MITKTYEDVPRKRAARELMIPRNKFETIVGLPGPNMDLCVAGYKNKGFKKIFLWENNLDVFKRQVAMLPIKGIQLSYGDIYDAPVMENTFYDFDFCTSIFSVGKYLEKFRKNFTLTICMRSANGCKLPEQMAEFARVRGEKFHSINLLDKNRYIIRTNIHQYYAITYADGAPMMCIKPL